MKLYLKELVACRVIEHNSEEIISTPLGQAMARHFIKLKTLKHLIKQNFTKLSEIADILRLLSQSPDLLSQIPFRGTDKSLLHKISTNPRLIYPLTSKVDWETWKKPYCFIQIALQSELAEFESKLSPSQRSDQETCIEHSCRLLKCTFKRYYDNLKCVFLVIIEVAVQRDLSLLLRNSLEFLSSLNGRSWHSSPKLLQQVPGIGQVGSNSLFNAGIRSIDGLRAADESRLEILLKRNPPFGRNLKKTIQETFPQVDLDCEIKDKVMKISLKSQNNSFKPKNKPVHLLVIAYNNPTSCRTLLYDQFNLTQLPLNRSVNLESCQESSFSCSLMFEDWSGLNQNICFEVEPKHVEVEQKNEQPDYELDLPSDFDFDLTDDDSCPVSNETITLSDRHRSPHPNITTNTQNIRNIPSTPKKQNIPLSPLSSKSSSKSNSCKHSCKDKFTCAHICCKSGLLKRPATKAQLPTTQSIKKPSFLSGARRSLTNAREYLRKYQPVNLDGSQLVLSNLQPTSHESDLYDEIEIALRYNQLILRFINRFLDQLNKENLFNICSP